ncbi:LLM class flavin-dependent oxidoreductase [Cellulosimicrobium cellulans]|uniref:LLM class flavin-dependent oxidoreductase n=1 Tax=Cellulosimicrobium cellulans TaxID=1710 RepID=UPI001962491E|nr:LLM class flavin-dependent oxidoreductase [Cellulosimicrobium cellulans]MBN0038866.1 LLM class flavin-dependent oxidoreductase [Cellulosimicrobium cellulans]
MALSTTTPALGVILPRELPADRIVPFARRAEEVGLDEVWVVEDLTFHGGIAQAATVLAATQRLTVGIGILPAATRAPSTAAMEAATLAALHPGRLHLGLGHGMPAWMRQIGVWPASPLAMLEETTATVRALLHGQRVTASGRYVSVDDVALHAPPASPPPVLAGVRGPRSLEVSGRVADGTILDMPVTPEYLAVARAAIDAGRASAGDAAPREHRVVAFSLGAVHDDVATARAIVRPHLAVLGEADWSAQIDPLPFADDFRALRDASDTPEAFAAAMPDAWVDALAVVGPPDAFRARLAELGAGGVSSVVLVATSPDAARPGDPFAALDALEAVAHAAQ